MGDPVQFQVHVGEDFAVNIQATREKLRSYVEAMKGTTQMRLYFWAHLLCLKGEMFSRKSAGGAELCSETIKTLIESSFRFIFTFRDGIGFEISHSKVCKKVDKSEQRQNAQKHKV